jgi:hypothetical protein
MLRRLVCRRNCGRCVLVAAALVEPDAVALAQSVAFANAQLVVRPYIWDQWCAPLLAFTVRY